MKRPVPRAHLAPAQSAYIQARIYRDHITDNTSDAWCAAQEQVVQAENALISWGKTILQQHNPRRYALVEQVFIRKLTPIQRQKLISLLLRLDATTLTE